MPELVRVKLPNGVEKTLPENHPAVTAEGVETSLVFERLRALGVDRVQGYLVSEPVPALELSSRCLRWKRRCWAWTCWAS